MQEFGLKNKFQKFGKYTILKKIAMGGMAEILLASDTNIAGQSLGRFVVIKKALMQYSDNKEFEEMFKTEGKIACTLKHRNIISVYEFGIEQNQMFLCVEHIMGKNMRELIKKLDLTKTKIPIACSLHVIKEIASGLEYAHNAIDSHTGKPLNLIHRDVSPQNIMFNFDGEIKLIDFGIAKVSDINLTQAGHLKGKFGYMSPEQAKGESLDNQTDIFCLGIILWELLANERLFSHKNEIACLKRVRACNVPDIQEINPKVNLQLKKIVDKALAKNKNIRYKTAGELEKDLTIFLNTNFPQFTQQDFSNFIKKNYSKEILKERETLKTYSQKLNSYLSSKKINKEESVMDFSKLSMDSLENQKSKGKVVETKTDFENLENQTQTELEDEYTGSEISIDESSQNMSYETESIVKNKSDQIQFSQSMPSQLLVEKRTSIRDTNTNTHAHHYTHSKSKSSFKTKSFFGLAVFILMIGSGVFVVKNINQISHSSFVKSLINLIPSDQNTESTTKVEQAQPELRNVAKELSFEKIHISTHPSGAELYLNKKPSGQSPAIVNFPKEGYVVLTIKKRGYISKSFQSNHGSKNIPKKLNIELKRNLKAPSF